MKKQTGIYIHIPFCKSKCAYCDFLSARPEDSKQIKRYISSLAEEIEKKAEEIPDSLKKADSVFFGGGTPSFLKAEELIFILEGLKRSFQISRDAEISIECNPGTVDIDKLFPLRKAGFNRLSFGLQSALDAELKLLGRIHTFAELEEAYADARAAGFENINVDIMSAIPGQTLESFKESLKRVVDLKPEHISCYSLILEEGTRLFEHLSEFPQLPDEDTEREMYHLARDYLRSEGYKQYEISNFCREGSGRDYRCRHNLGYWERAVYFGFGAGAASFDGQVRYKNISGIEEYIVGVTRRDPSTGSGSAEGAGSGSAEGAGSGSAEGTGSGSAEGSDKSGFKEDISQRERLSRADAMSEFMFLGLRKTEGISGKDFLESFGVELEEIFGDVIEKHIGYGLMEKTYEGFRLTERGVDLSNQVFADF